jgi:predicted SnoaL-like aldol condensation-catalyzing enzyme
MPRESGESSKRVVSRYFEMWNTGRTSIAQQVLDPGWVDHAHPEVNGPAAVEKEIARIRERRPDLRFEIDAVLEQGDLVVVVGNAGPEPAFATGQAHLVWLIRMRDGRMAEMWTYMRTNP